MAYEIVRPTSIFQVAFIGLHKVGEQAIDFLQIPYSLANVLLKAGILPGKLVYVPRLPIQLGIYELPHSLLDNTLLIVIERFGH
ncbi:MAG TPA: hypothetical protein VJJ98_02190 [Sedimentisphaerales bacterium]|nr:hypothetical protein [Sedimentisphaerales bacterium]